MPTKYIKTKDNQIIVFSSAIKHIEFAHFKPISAGFIHFFYDNGSVDCICEGMSMSLDLKADKDDARIAKLQLLSNL